MKPYVVLLVTWALAGVGAVAGSILGNAAGKAGLFLGAFVGGVLGVLGAVFATTKLQWLPPLERGGALIGGICGFALATPIAVSNLHTPLTPVLSCSLAGLGVLIGAGLSRGWHRP
jgi:hypothetical protein